MTSPASDRPLFQAVEAYERFMGRYSRPLAAEFARAAGVRQGDRVLDVGCGTGALTRELAELVGAQLVAAVDPSEPFVAACRQHVPSVDVRLGDAEALPFEDDSFDRVLAQLVIHFVTDPAGAVGEMTRVARPGGTIAACVWDFTGGMTTLRAYWDAALEVDADAPDEIGRVGGRPGQLAELFRSNGLGQVEQRTLTVSPAYDDFEELWDSCLGGSGPVGAHAASLDEARRRALREGLYRRVGSPAGPFTMRASAWCAIGVV